MTDQERIDYTDFDADLLVGRALGDDPGFWDGYEDGIRLGEQLGLEADLAGLCMACWTENCRSCCGGPHCPATA